MKRATVRDLRNSFARISRWIEAGESVEVTKRGRLFARILPAAAPKGRRAPKPDILARLRAGFGDVVFPDKTIDEVLRESGASHVEGLSWHEFPVEPVSVTQSPRSAAGSGFSDTHGR